MAEMKKLFKGLTVADWIAMSVFTFLVALLIIATVAGIEGLGK